MESKTTRASTVSARIAPASGMDVLSRQEIARLHDASAGGLHELLRRCALAVLTQGAVSDDACAMLERYPQFNIHVLQQDRGIRLDLVNAPAEAFVDGVIIRGIRELLYAVLRDIVYVSEQVGGGHFDLSESFGITNAVFEILRNARVLRANVDPNLVVCWGGHSISREEYNYTKKVGYELGLRGLDICTGCGPGAMKGPMKGATIAHAKQRRHYNRYIGITEPDIIEAESPNAIVNNLVVMPNIEKRLEAFVRVAHSIIVFPGGVGTAEEILYLLGILLHPDNQGMVFPVIFACPAASAPYFERIDRFLRLALGNGVAEHYRIIVDDPIAVAHAAIEGMRSVRDHRIGNQDAFFFNWALHIEKNFQVPFEPTHETMAALDLHRDRPRHELAADLRRAFSGIVAGNVKQRGMQTIGQRGPFVIDGDADIMRALDALLTSFVEQQRMKLPGPRYVPCYRVRVGGG
ncbi:MAG: nucleotide 5'-monophosphate nucleosidase PpnN [Rhodanobacteraceae bacterium]